MKEKKSQHKIFKADPAKIEAYQLLGNNYDFTKDHLDAEGLTNKLREERTGKGDEKTPRSCGPKGP